MIYKFKGKWRQCSSGICRVNQFNQSIQYSMITFPVVKKQWTSIYFGLKRTFHSRTFIYSTQLGNFLRTLSLFSLCNLYQITYIHTHTHLSTKPAKNENANEMKRTSLHSATYLYIISIFLFALAVYRGPVILAYISCLFLLLFFLSHSALCIFKFK